MGKNLNMKQKGDAPIYPGSIFETPRELNFGIARNRYALVFAKKKSKKSGREIVG